MTCIFPFRIWRGNVTITGNRLHLNLSISNRITFTISSTITAAITVTIIFIPIFFIIIIVLFFMLASKDGLGFAL